MNKLLFGLIVLVFVGANAPALAQCDIGVDYEVEISQSEKTGSIVISFQESYGDVTLRLFNLRSKNYEFTAVKEVKSSEKGSKVVFENLAFSEYLIQLETEVCKRTIGGIEGIKVAEDTL